MAKDIEIDVSCVGTAKELHSLLAATLRFPDYYGMNWDAFDDCIDDPDSSEMPDKLVIRGWSQLNGKLPRDAALFRECLEDHQEKRADFRLEWC